MKKKTNDYLRYFLVFLIGFLLSIWIFYEPKINEKPVIILNSTILRGSSNILAVTQNNSGIIGKVSVEITEGTGRILVNTNPFLEPDTQLSANIAALVASNITNFDLKNKNIIYDFDINGDVLGGPSSSAIETLIIIYTLQNKTLPDNIFMTGAILPNGNIGPVGAILEKGLVIPKGSLFLIPKNQSIFIFYQPIKSTKNINGVNLISTNYIKKQVNLTEYFKTEKNITLIEVKDINEAINIIDNIDE